ncbi:Ribonuclease T2 precursor (RNase T2) [Lithohypha guttulata]|uniref:ribonuclease T2 n=1 Tax=Lithohypha guttulata TaxID=1690604 RepID=A0AAN7YBG2_9EURO|nr:Ribonuclease T2 precursor (RNase T2) [Lithohypha guttulata]KAK5097152.1 Ribonuclease T2 precursor (RNase T2) [Lithohypha guttulata]
METRIFMLQLLLQFLVLRVESRLNAGRDSEHRIPTIDSAICIPAVSCSLKSVPNLDGCCINDPSGHFLQTQFWDTEPPQGGPTSWTIHGLWPDWCDGGFDAYCDSSRTHSAEAIIGILSNASTAQVVGGTRPGLLEFMTKHWLSLDSNNAHLWSHEWNKHGTCISTLRPKCYENHQSSTRSASEGSNGDVLDYFTHAALLYSSLPTYDFFERHGIVPSHDKTYELDHLQRAIQDSPHGADATIKCRNHNELSEIWYSFHVRASLRDAMDLWWDGNKQWNTWVPASPQGQVSNCPATGIKYLPKHGLEQPPSSTMTHTRTATATATHTPRATTKPFVGQGRMMVKVVSDESMVENLGEQKPLAESSAQSEDLESATRQPIPTRYTGCLIRKGTWYMSHSLTSCAIFTAHDDVKAPSTEHLIHRDDEDYHLFTLASRFAPCSFVEGSRSTSPTVASDDNGDNEEVTDTVGSMYFACSDDLPFQSILSNDASVSKQHTEAAKRLTFGAQHKSTFYAEKIPRKAQQVELWTDDGWGSRKIKVEIYWEGI